MKGMEEFEEYDEEASASDYSDVSGSEDSDDDDADGASTKDVRVACTVRGTYNAETRCIECECPSMAVGGTVAVEVACDGEHFTRNGALFSYYTSPTIETLEPKCAHLGETVPIKLGGRGFQDDISLWYVRIREENTGMSAVYHAELADARSPKMDQKRFIDVVADTSAFEGAEGDQIIVSVEVSANGQDYSSFGHTMLMPCVSVHTFEPASIPCTHGPVQMVARGTGFAAAPSIRARAKLFDPRTGIDVSQVKAGVVDGGVACTVDSFDAIVALIEECDHNSVELGLKISLNQGKHWARSSATLTFYVGSVSSIVPACGPRDVASTIELLLDTDPPWYFPSSDAVVRVAREDGEPVADLPVDFDAATKKLTFTMPANVGTAMAEEAKSCEGKEDEGKEDGRDAADESKAEAESATLLEEEPENGEGGALCETFRVSLLINGAHADGECVFVTYGRPSFGAPLPASCKGRAGVECRAEQLSIPWQGGWESSDLAVCFDWDVRTLRVATVMVQKD